MTDFWYPALAGGSSTCPHGGLRAYCPYCNTATITLRSEPHVPMGWQCACKRVYSPDVLQCPHCGPAAPPENDLCLTDDECVPPEEGGTCTGGRHCSC